jgi:hypothetical protein
MSQSASTGTDLIELNASLGWNLLAFMLSSVLLLNAENIDAFGHYAESQDFKQNADSSCAKQCRARNSAMLKKHHLFYTTTMADSTPVLIHV